MYTLTNIYWNRSFAYDFKVHLSWLVWKMFCSIFLYNGNHNAGWAYFSCHFRICTESSCIVWHSLGAIQQFAWSHLNVSMFSSHPSTHCFGSNRYVWDSWSAWRAGMLRMPFPLRQFLLVNVTCAPDQNGFLVYHKCCLEIIITLLAFKVL